MGIRWGYVFCTASLFLASFAVDDVTAQVELFVAVEGDDSNAGTATRPLATIEGARRRIEQMRGEGTDSSTPIVVTVRSGLYELAEELEFSERDSGSEPAQVVYRAEKSRGVILRGGKAITRIHRVDNEVCEYPFPDKANVWRVDLQGLNLPSLDNAARQSRTRSLHQAMQAEPIHLVANGNLQELARWPSAGWARTEHVGADGAGWSVATTELGNSNFPNGPHAWAHGFWQSDWEDACHAIEFATINGMTNIRFCENTDCRVSPGARFRVENLATQLDANGEWFLDADARQAYVFHEASPPQSVFVPQLACPVSFYGASHIRFEGFTIEGASNCGVEIAGGERIELRDCEIQHVGNTCVHLFQGDSHSVLNCELHDAGAGGVRVEAGDRATLTAANHRIANNEIHHYSHCQLAYRPAVSAIGVGIRIEGNTIHDGPHAAIILEGNEHTVIDNEIAYVCLETDDVGAICLAGNPTYLGNRIVSNYIHHLGNSEFQGVVGIYLDDFTSGTSVADNVLQSMPRGIAIGGGRDNSVEGNIVLDCLAAIQIDDRGTTWAADFFAQPDSTFAKLTGEVATNAAYQTRYPQLTNMLGDAPQLPKGNRIVGNWVSGRVGIDLQGANTKRLVAVEQNVLDAKRYLVDRGDGQFELNAAGEALLAETKNESIGKSRYVRRMDVSSERSPSDRLPD